MWRQKTDKRLVAAVLAVLGLIVGYGAWQDMHPKPPQSKPQAFSRYHFVSGDRELAAAPQDGTPIIVWTGTLAPGEGNGETKFTPSPVTPVLFPQREILLLYKIDGALPRSFSPAFKGVEDGARAWKNAGNLINDIYIDYPADNPDLRALTAFCNGLRAHLEREYWIDAQLKRGSAALDTERRTALGNLLKSVRMLVYEANDVRKPDESLEQTILRLSPEGLPFALRIHAEPDYIALKKALAGKAENFLGFVLDIDRTTEEKAP